MQRAAEANDVKGALVAYESLAAAAGAPDAAALRAVAYAAAHGLTNASDTTVRLVACGITLVRDQNNQACWQFVQAETGPSVGRDTQTLRAFALANVGLRPWPGLLDEEALDVSRQTRLIIARRNTRLPARERVQVLVRMLDQEQGQAPGLEAVAVLGDIGTPEARAALSTLAGSTSNFTLRIAAQTARARLGEPDAVAFVEQMRSSLMGPQLVEVSTALAVAGSRNAPDPARFLETTPAQDRPRLAVNLARSHPDLARATLRTLVAGQDSSSVRVLALEAAGTLAMGTEPAVYQRMVDADPSVRLAAVNAVLHTLDQMAPDTRPPQ